MRQHLHTSQERGLTEKREQAVNKTDGDEFRAFQDPSSVQPAASTSRDTESEEYSSTCKNQTGPLALVMLDREDEAPTTSELILLQYGVEPAHMGWCEPDHILNSRPLDQTRDFFDT